MDCILEKNSKKRIGLTVVVILGIIVILFGTAIFLCEDRSFKGLSSFLYTYYEVYIYACISIFVWSLFYVIRKKERSLLQNITFQLLSILISLANINILFYIKTFSNKFNITAVSNIVDVKFMMFMSLVITVCTCIFVELGISLIIYIYGKLKEHLPVVSFSINIDRLMKVRYDIIIFIILVLDLFIKHPQKIIEWCAAWYVFDWDMGIGSRFLPGVILNSIVPGDYISKDAVYIYVMIATVIVIGLVSYLLGKVISKCNKENFVGVMFLVGIFLASPGCISYLWYKGNMGRLELFVIIFVLIGVIGYNKIRNFGKYILLSVITVLCMACHQGYLFLFFPIIFTVIVYDLFENGKISASKILGCLLVCLVTLGSFIYFQFNTNIGFSSASEMSEYISKHSNIDYLEEPIEYEYFKSVQAVFYEFNVPFMEHNYPRDKQILTFIYISPLMILLCFIWMNTWKNIQQNKVLSSVMWILLCNLMIIPQFILNIDWGRWCGAIVVVQFFQILYFVYNGNKEMLGSCKSLSYFIRNNKILSICILIFFINCGKFQTKYCLDSVGNVFNNIITKLNLILWDL